MSDEQSAAARQIRGTFTIDERGIRQGLAQNDAKSNIASINPALIDEDARAYASIPMIRPPPLVADPLNTAPAEDATAELQHELVKRSREARLLNAPPTEEPVIVAAPAPALAPARGENPPPVSGHGVEAVLLTFPRRCSQVAAGIFHDLRHWESLPCASHAQKAKYVLQRDNRVVYLLGLLAAVIVIMAIIHSMM